MAITAYISRTQSDPRQLIKGLADITDVNNIRPTGVVDLINPTFELDYNPNYVDKNYIEVGAPFNRDYFITDMKIDIGKKIYISCAVDVLYTYFREIVEAEAYITRTAHEADIADYLPDDCVPVTTNAQTQNYAFSSTPFQTIDGVDGNYVLTVVGGGA